MKKLVSVLFILLFAVSAFALEIPNGSSSYVLLFSCKDSAGAGITGLTPTVKVSKNGATGVSVSGAVSQVDSTNLPGLYKVAGNAGDSDVNGTLWLHATCSGGVDFLNPVASVVAVNPYDAVHYGLSAIPNATAGASAGLLIDGSNAATVTFADGVAINRSTSNGSALVVTGNGTGSGAKFISGSGATGNGLEATSASTNGSGLIGTGTGTGADIKGSALEQLMSKAVASSFSGTVAANSVLGYLADVSATSAYDRTTMSVEAAYSNAPTLANMSTQVWQDATSGDFTAAGSIGKSLFLNAAPGASGGHLISGTNSGTTSFGAFQVAGGAAFLDGLSIARTTTNQNGLTIAGSGTGAGVAIASGAGATGDGITISSIATNGKGLNIAGSGTGAGAAITSGAGATGDGVTISSSASNGNGLNVSSTGTGVGLLANAVKVTNGVTLAQGITNAPAMIITGNGTGDGVQIFSGSSGGGDALKIEAHSTTGDGLSLNSTGSGKGLDINAVLVANGTTLSQGISNQPALVVTGNGTGSGAVFTSGSGATGNGISLVSASTNGNGLSATGTGTGGGFSAGTFYIAGVSNVAQTGNSFTRLGAPAGASIAADIAGVSASGSVTIQKNTAFSNFGIWMRNAANAGIVGLTTSQISCQVQKDAGAWAPLTDTTAVGIGLGKYVVDLTAAELNGNFVSLLCTGTGATPYLTNITPQR